MAAAQSGGAKKKSHDGATPRDTSPRIATMSTLTDSSMPDPDGPTFDPGLDVAILVFSHVEHVKTRLNLARVSKLWLQASKPAAAHPLVCRWDGISNPTRQTFFLISNCIYQKVGWGLIPRGKTKSGYRNTLCLRYKAVRRTAYISLEPEPEPVDVGDNVDGFMSVARFAGAKPGYVYKKDNRGLGYYVDTASTPKDPAAVPPPKRNDRVFNRATVGCSVVYQWCKAVFRRIINPCFE